MKKSLDIILSRLFLTQLRLIFKPNSKNRIILILSNFKYLFFTVLSVPFFMLLRPTPQPGIKMNAFYEDLINILNSRSSILLKYPRNQKQFSLNLNLKIIKKSHLHPVSDTFINIRYFNNRYLNKWYLIGISIKGVRSLRRQGQSPYISVAK